MPERSSRTLLKRVAGAVVIAFLGLLLLVFVRETVGPGLLSAIVLGSTTLGVLWALGLLRSRRKKTQSTTSATRLQAKEHLEAYGALDKLETENPKKAEKRLRDIEDRLTD